MKTIVIIAFFALFGLTASNSKKEVKNEFTKSLKILNIHDTKDAKILLA